MGGKNPSSMCHHLIAFPANDAQGIYANILSAFCTNTRHHIYIITRGSHYTEHHYTRSREINNYREKDEYEPEHHAF